MTKKQTVYLPVNGEPPLVVCYDNSDWYDSITGVVEKKGYFFTPEQLNEYTANVIKQALETAAENVHLIEYAYRDNRVTNENAGQFYFVPSYYGEDNEVEISKQSITNTFEETLKQFKV